MELVQTEQISQPQNHSEPDRCFICYGEDNLLQDNIHCGTTVYHKTCINDYCNTKETISCPICRKDITDKFTKKNIVVWRPKWNGLSANNEICEKFMMMLALWIPVIIIILSFVVYSFLPNYHTMFIIKGISGYIINLGIIGMAILLLKYTNSGSDCMGILAIILTVFSVLITPLIFLIMSSISLHHQNVLATDKVEFGFTILVLIPMGLLSGILLICLSIAFVVSLIGTCLQVLEPIYSATSCYGIESVYVVNKNALGNENNTDVNVADV